MYRPGLTATTAGRALLALVLGLAAPALLAQADAILRDPTAPIGQSGGGAADRGSTLPDWREVFEDYQVNSILVRPGGSVAVINSRRVRVGDRVGGATVSAISPGSVTLDINGERKKVKLYQGTVKTRTGEDRQ